MDFCYATCLKMKKYSYRIIISGIKEDIEALCKHKGITDPEYIKTVRQKDSSVLMFAAMNSFAKSMQNQKT